MVLKSFSPIDLRYAIVFLFSLFTGLILNVDKP